MGAVGLPQEISACLFDLDGGASAEQEHLAGKPAPASRAGEFGYVVGVDRVGQADQLTAHGADTVVSDLADLMRHR